MIADLNRSLVASLAASVLAFGWAGAQPTARADSEPPGVVSELTAEIAWVNDQLRSIEWTGRHLDKARQELAELEHQLTILGSLLPPSPGLEEWLHGLRSLAARKQVTVVTVAPAETISHDGYDEIRLHLRLRGSSEAIDSLGQRILRSPRIASWRLLETAEGVAHVEQSVFTAPSLDTPPRSCKLFTQAELASDPRAPELHEKLRTRCEELDRADPSLRELVARRERVQDRIALIARLKQEHSAEQTPDELDIDAISDELLGTRQDATRTPAEDEPGPTSQTSQADPVIAGIRSHTA